jgi:NTP pyrophosphatase (non-canonical NTP hydrolase)
MDNKNMKYYLYHIPGKKIGVTTDLYERVECQQGYGPDEYQVIMSTEDIDLISKKEISLQKALGYKVDMKPYNKLKCNNMKINITEQTTTFPCPVNKLKGNLMDNIGLTWETDHGKFHLDEGTIAWVLRNVKTSQFTNDRCYVYNKAFSRYYDNHYDYRLDNAKQMNLHEQLHDQYNGKCRTGALSPAGINEEKCPDCDCMSHFDLIREWAETRGLYNEGDPKTQTLKLMEEAGEICRAVLKKDEPEIIDGIGDCIVVLTNLAHLCDTSIEECIEAAYDEIKGRSGKMVNGTFKKD